MYSNKPLAAHPLKSYRYRLNHGYIMIGAKDHADAMSEASRSTHFAIEKNRLQIWDGVKYVDAF